MDDNSATKVGELKKVLLITYYWPPSGGAGVQRALKFAKYFPEFGIEPFILTVDENYASYPLLDATLLNDVSKELKVIKTGSVEPLRFLSFFSGKEKIPHGGFANSNKEKFSQKFLRFMRGNLFIPDARVGWVRFATKAALDIIKREGIDTVVISSPPHSSQLIGLWLKKKTNIRWIADMRDPWTDIYYYKDMLHMKFSASRDAKIERKVLENADDVIVVSNPLREMFLKKSDKIFAEKFHTIPNGFDENDFQAVNEIPNDKFVITYVGSIAESYKPEIFFEAMQRVVEEFKSISFNIRFVGSLPDAIKKIIDRYNLKRNIDFISHVSHDKAVQFMQHSTALLLLIPDMPGSEGILTGKLFEYLATKRPIIGLGPVQGEASKILDECEAGKMFERSESERLYFHIKSLILQWSEKKNLSTSNDRYKKYSRKGLTGEISKIILNRN